MIEEISLQVYKMASFENLTTKKIKMLSKARNIGGYENMSQQQLRSIFTAPFTSKLAPKPA